MLKGRAPTYAAIFEGNKQENKERNREESSIPSKFHVLEGVL